MLNLVNSPLSLLWSSRSLDLNASFVLLLCIFVIHLKKDWFLDVTSADYRSTDSEGNSLRRIDTLSERWLSTPKGTWSSVEERAVAVQASANQDEALPTYQSSVFRQVFHFSGNGIRKCERT